MKIWQTNPDLCIFVFTIISASLGYLMGSMTSKEMHKHQLFHEYEVQDNLNLTITELQADLKLMQSDFTELVQASLRDSE
jgi:hypothetical protein